jgi:MFS family permease
MGLISDVRSVLHEPHFGRLYATRLVSQGSDGLFQVALASYVLFNPEQQADASRVAAGFAVLLLPYSLVGPFAGVFIDRWRRQRLLTYAPLLKAAVALVVAGLAASGRSGPEFFLTVLALMSISRFYLSAQSAALPHVVRGEMLVVGNSLSTTSGTVLGIIGGGVGYLVTRIVGSGNGASALIIILAAAAYVMSAAIARRMAADLLGPDQGPNRADTRRELRTVAQGLVEGAKHVWQQRPAGVALLAMAGHRFLYGVATVSALLLYRNYFNGGTNPEAGLGGLGLIFAASAIGYLTAAVITPRMAELLGKERWITTLFAAAAVLDFVLVLPYEQRSLIAAAAVLGVVAQGTKICVDTIVQENVADAFRGRVFAFYDMAFNVAFVSAAVFGAMAMPDTGKSLPVLLVVTLGYAAISITYGRWSAAQRLSSSAAASLPIGPRSIRSSSKNL